MKFFNFKELKEEQAEFYYKLFRNIASVIFIFAIIVSVILTSNYISMKLNDPVNSPALQEMIMQAHQNRDNTKLTESVRELDLMIRKAHFTSESFRSFGTALLIGSLILLFIVIKLLSELRKRDPDPGKYSERQENPVLIRRMQKGIVAVSGLLFLSALLLPFLFRNDFDKYLSSTGGTEENDVSVKFATEEAMKKNWPSFRGYNSMGISHAVNVPVNWSGKSGRNIKWKAGIPGPGYNSPVVWNNRVFLAGGDREARSVFCFDSENGVLLWRYDVTASNSQLPETTDNTGFAAPGMCTEGNYVFAIFATGELICLDFEGKKIWEKSLPSPKNHYGHSSSLLTYKNYLLVQYDQAEGSKIIALNTATGKTEWEKKREVEVTWTSPVLIPGDKPQLILTAVPFVSSYDPESGKMLWKLDDVVTGELGSSPAYINDTLFFANQLSRLAAVDIKEKKIIWEFSDDLPDASSLAALNDLVFVPTSYGMVTCLNSKDGKVLWTHKFDDGFYGSPVIAEGKIYAVDMKGITRIFKAENTFQLVGSPDIGEVSVCTPAVVDNRIYIRGDKNLFCIGN